MKPHFFFKGVDCEEAACVNPDCKEAVFVNLTAKKQPLSTLAVFVNLTAKKQLVSTLTAKKQFLST